MPTAFMGMRGSADYTAAVERPYNWREGMKLLYPNGDMVLTAMTGSMKSEKVDDAMFNWFDKTLPSQTATFTAGTIYTESTLGTAYSGSGVAGTVLYVKLSAANAAFFRVGHQVLLRDADDPSVDVVAKVVSVMVNGDTSYVACRLLEADDNGSSAAGSHDLQNADTISVCGNVNAEGAGVPNSISYEADRHCNWTGIFRTSLEITRTARRTKLRTGDAYKELKREALELHGIEMEKAFLWSIATENTAQSGKKERTTQGLINKIKTDASGNVSDYRYDSTATPSPSGKTWVQGGMDWLNYYLELVFRYGKDEKLAFCGSGTILALHQLAMTYGDIQLNVGATAFGLKVTTWELPFGAIHLKRHPLFSYNATDRYSMLVFEPERLTYKYIDDTDFYPDPSRDKKTGGHTHIDGVCEEWLTEAGLAVDFPQCAGYYTGFGHTNAV